MVVASCCISHCCVLHRQCLTVTQVTVRSSAKWSQWMSFLLLLKRPHWFWATGEKNSLGSSVVVSEPPMISANHASASFFSWPCFQQYVFILAAGATLTHMCIHTYLSLHLAALEVIISEISRKGNCLWTRLSHLEVIISSLTDVTPSVKCAAPLAKKKEEKHRAEPAAPLIHPPAGMSVLCQCAWVESRTMLHWSCRRPKCLRLK